MHFGQDVRVNVHLCLVGCNASEITVAGETLPYSDGSFFAFEDRADHEIFNRGSEDRLNLVIGVLHPDFAPEAREFPTRGHRLEYILDNRAAVSKPRLAEGLALAAYYNYTAPLKALL